MFKPTSWDYLTNEEKIENISKRMDIIYNHELKKTWKYRYALDEQLKEKEEDITAITALIEIKKEYESIREWVLKNKHNIMTISINVNILEQLLQEDVEKILLGDMRESKSDNDKIEP